MNILLGIFVGVCLFPSAYIAALYINERWGK